MLLLHLGQVICPGCNVERDSDEYIHCERRAKDGIHVDLICPDCEAFIMDYNFHPFT